MKRYSFRTGMRFNEQQSQIGWQISRRLATGKIQLVSDTGEVLNLSDTELQQRWLSQTWLVDEATLGTRANTVYLTTPRDLGTYPPRQQAEAKRRQHYLIAIDPEKNPYKPKEWAVLIEAIARDIEDPHPPGPSSVQNWWRRYRVSQSIVALIPHDKAFRSKPAKRQRQIFEEVVQTVYMSNQQLPKLAVVEEVFRQIDAINNGLDQSKHIRRPGRATVYRWLEDLQSDLVDKARLGAEASRIKYRSSVGTIKVSGVLERMEIDHTPLDLIVIDSSTQLPLGRPWLTLALDYYSRMVMGFYISFNAPSSHGVLQCLRRSILPKDELLQQFPDINGKWPAYGIPELLAVDNGADLHSDALESTCQEMGIQLLFCGAKTPQHKGAIERFFRTLNMGLVHRLPGTVFSNVDHRGDYPSEEKAVLDTKTLVHLLTKWIVDVYNATLHKGISSRPIDRWLQSVERRIVELPVDPQQLEVIAGIPSKRTLFHYGIELEGLQYNSDQLQTLRRRAGENKEVSLKYYEDSIAYIHVYDDYSKEYIKVPAKIHGYAEDLSRDVHRLIRGHVRKQNADHIQAPDLLKAKAEIQSLVQDALKAKKMKHRKAGAKHVMHDSEAVLLGTDPLSVAKRPIRSTKQAPPEVLPPGLDDELPNFLGNGRVRDGD